MARIQLASTRVQKQYRDQLPQNQKQVFDRLVQLLAEPGNDLWWYYACG